jgi:lipopolysaccharide assembly protein A
VRSEATTRWVNITIVVLFAAVTLTFLIQNREIVSMDFLGFSLRAPLAVMAAVFYLLGAITGGSAFVLLRRSVQEARTPAIAQP